METKPCPMCQRPKARLSNPEGTDRRVKDILGHFEELPIDLFQGSQFCPDCLKLLALTHQVGMKIRKRKQGQEEPGKSPAAIPGRRPSSEAKQSLAKRIRSTQEKGQSLDSIAGSATGSDGKYGSEGELATGKDFTVSHSDDEEFRNDDDECSRSFRSRTRTL